MSAAPEDSEDERAMARERVAQVLDEGEVRAVIFAAVALAVFLYFIKLILLPFVLPAIVAYICTPALDWLARRTGWPRLLFAVAFFLAILGIAGTFVAFASTRLVAEAQSVMASLQDVLQKVLGGAFNHRPITVLGYSVDAQQIARWALEQARGWLSQADHLALFAGYGLEALMGAFLSVVMLFYFLVSGERIAQGILWMAPPHRRPLVRRIWARLDPVLLRYFIGMIAVVMYATVASYVGLGFFLGIQHAVLLALLTGVLETVPVIGPTSAAFLAGLVSLQTATGIMSIVNYALYAVALRLSIDQLFGPIVLGTAAHVHPILIIFCFLAGGVVFGIPGVILAVPVALLIKSTLQTLYGDEGL